jgi:hypothetical protein
MKILIKLLLLLGFICNAQTQAKCTPKNLDSISNLVIKEMSLRSLDEINKAKNLIIILYQANTSIILKTTNLLYHS